MKYLSRQQGFSLMELVVSMAIFLIIGSASFLALQSGQKLWSDTTTIMALQHNLRNALKRMAMELRQSGNDYNGATTLQVTLFDGTGVNNTDIIRFSIPILCESGGSYLNSSGKVANWGAPLTWMCDTSSCMDADNNCATREYQFIQYALNADHELVRSVLDPSASEVQSSVQARNLIDFQVTTNTAGNTYTLSVTAQDTTSLNRLITVSDTIEVYLRNF